MALDQYCQNWRELSIHESSPAGAASDKLARECGNYTPTQFFIGIQRGALKDGVRCETLEALTFGSETFDVVITQDVLEHVLDPAKAFKEIARTLRPGGMHIFTVPWTSWKRTLVRAVRTGDEIRHLLPPTYHRNPIDPQGALVVTEWGSNLFEFIQKHSELETTVMRHSSRRLGLKGECLEVFVSRKRMNNAAR